jgi:hypothetical protein
MRKCMLSKGTASRAQLGYVRSKERMPRNPHHPYLLPTSPSLDSFRFDDSPRIHNCRYTTNLNTFGFL